MSLTDYFRGAEGTGILATSDSAGNVDLAIYSRPFVIDEDKVAFSMLEKTSFANIQSNPKAAYMFIEKGEGYSGKRLYLSKLGEETDPQRIEEIKSQHPKRHKSKSEAARHLVYFNVEKIRPLVG
ncbi:MAG: pyridoxamine 5'-phosphate oxidase family protein [Sedimentisphaerales bacterium]|nr:pyridoxamine 5'-phosphate oxidase family protein [Sedimentisphaerales bacterium]